MVLMMIHKVGLMLTIVFGLIYFAKRTEQRKKLHSIFGLLTIASFLLDIFVNNFTNKGYFLYALLLLMAGISPYFYKKKGKVAIHLSLVGAAIVWLVLIHMI